MQKRKRSRRTGFWREVLAGIVTIGEGLYTIIDSCVRACRPRRPWKYEEHFGTDEEQLLRDLDVVLDDFQTALLDNASALTPEERERLHQAVLADTERIREEIRETAKRRKDEDAEAS